MSSFSRRIHAHYAATLLGPDNEKEEHSSEHPSRTAIPPTAAHAISLSIAPIFDVRFNERKCVSIEQRTHRIAI